MNPKLILLIDDDPAVLDSLNSALQPQYQTRIATHGAKALALAKLAPIPDLILLDVELPDMTGYEICAALKHDPITEHVPIMFLSSHSDVGDITYGLSLGAVDYVTKPVALPIVQARVETHLRLQEAHNFLQNQNLHLETLVRERTRALETKSLELQRNQDLTILAMGSICETRDNETGNHIHRTSAYVQILAERLAKLPKYKGSMVAEEWEMIWKSAPLHDIGKVGIPDHILLKPARLTTEEFSIMRTHTTLGRDAIRMAEARIQARDTFLRIASDIAYCHHEHWNGNGYPEGIRGESIPLAARMMAVADVYDALISKRVYKPAMPHEEAVAIIVDGKEKQFDPVIVDCLMEDSHAFQEAALRYQD